MPSVLHALQKVELVSCFHGIDRRVKVEVKAAAAETLAYEVRTVKERPPPTGLALTSPPRPN